MKSSTIVPVAALATLGQATWPSPLSASNLTTHGSSSLPPLETISLPSVPSAPRSSSSRQPVEAHTLSSQPTAHNVSTHSPGAAISVSSLPTTHQSSSHRRIVYHTLPSPPTMHSPSSSRSVVAHSVSSPSPAHNSSSHRHIVYHTLPSQPTQANSSSHPSKVSHSHSGLSAAHNSSSTPSATNIPVSQPFAATISVVDVSPSATTCVCHGDRHDPLCCHRETRWQTITRLVLIPVPTTVVDYNGETRTVTKDMLSTVTNIQHGGCTATVIDYKTHITCKQPGPTTWDPPPRPIRPYPSIVLSTSRKPGPTPWYPPRKPHGTVRPYPPDDKKKHYKPTYTISVFGPEATCPVGFTCQPDDDYVGKKLAVREAKVSWPAPPGCANHCVGGQGCWTECDKAHQEKPSRICPEGYSCQRKTKPAPVPVPEPPKQQQPPPEQRPAPKQQPAPPAAYPGPPPVPAPMPPPPPFVPGPAAQPPPAAPPPVVLPPKGSPPVAPLPPAAPSVALPPPVSPPAVGRPPAASPKSKAPSSAAPVQPSTRVKTAPGVPPAPSHHCPAGEHRCRHHHSNETVGAPETVTKAGAGLSMPAVAMAMIFAFGFGLLMI